jgi:DNA-binding response OmpR family regulator
MQPYYFTLKTFISMRKEILVIDDNRTIRFMLHYILKENYNVTSVADGMSAMYWLRKNRLPDLIIVDPELDDFPDWELVRYLHGSHVYGTIPVVVLSNRTSEEMQSNIIHYGVADFFQKPLKPQPLLECVGDILVGSTQDRIF